MTNLRYTDTSNTQQIVVPDSDINTETSLTFVGKNYNLGYSKFIGENFLHLLENFASNAQPERPVKGQLWYKTGTDRNPPEPKLMVFDGARWSEAGSVKKGNTKPAAEVSVVGDLWVDTSNQQLYLYTGFSWVLVGPQFSEGSLSGIKAEEIIDRDTNTGKFVLVCYVNDSRIIIISKFTFVPKNAIPGFEVIRQGVNMSTEDFDLDGFMLNKFWGTAEKSNALVVGNSTVPAVNFLRGDTVSTTDYVLNIRTSSGINLGDSLETSLTVTDSGVILTHKTRNSPIILRTTNTSGVANNVVTVTGEKQVGINNPTPTVDLDVVGEVKIRTAAGADTEPVSPGRLTVFGTQSSTSTSTGALRVFGGVGIAGALNVGNNTSITGQLIVGPAVTGVAIVPRITNGQDIGATGTRFRDVYTQRVIADSIGSPSDPATVYGSVTGAAGSASRLTNVSQFLMTGDVTSVNTIAFTGGQISELDRTIATVARSGNIATITTTAPHEYDTGYIVSVVCANSTFNTAGTVAVITRIDPNTFTYSNVGTSVTSTATTGTVSVNPGGTFITALGDGVISNRVDLTTSQDSDFFLTFREGLGLRKISKATLFSTAGTVPAGSIMPFAGDTPPAGYLLCDGSEQSQALYPELFAVLGYKYKNISLLQGFQTFALPDLRGRFALGRENMDNGNQINIQISATGVQRLAITTIGAISATFVVPNATTTNGPFQTGRTLAGTGLDTTGGSAVITDVVNNSPSAGFTTLTVSVPSQNTIYPSTSGLTIESIGIIDSGGGSPSPSRVPAATDLGIVGGQSTRTLTAAQMPTHGHLFDDIRWSEVSGTNTYNDPQLGVINVGNGAGSNRGTDYDNGAHFLQHGTYNAGGSQPIDMMNPYQTINYIIFTGRIT
jgi:microcystin-dependent protein